MPRPTVLAPRKSDDGGLTWTWVLDGLDHMDLWSARAGKLAGRDVVCVGALPAHLYISENRGKTWRELPALRNAPSVGKWCFPPPPRIGHVKDIVFDGDRLLVGIEIGALAGVEGFRRKLHRACTSIPIRSSAISIACWCIPIGRIASSSPTASSA